MHYDLKKTKSQPDSGYDSGSSKARQDSGYKYDYSKHSKTQPDSGYKYDYSKHSKTRPESGSSKEKTSSSESNLIKFLQNHEIRCVYKINTSNYYRNVNIYNYKKRIII